MKTNLITLAFILLISTLKSQISYKERIEFELNDDYTNEQIIEFGEDGFVIFSKHQKPVEGAFEWKYEKYNTDLKQEYSTGTRVNKKLLRDETFVAKNKIHTFFKDRKGNFTLVSTDVKQLEITKVDGKLPKNIFISDMVVSNDYAFFNAKLKKSPFLFSINWKTGEKKLIPIHINNINPKKISLMNFQIMDESKEIFLYAKAYLNKKATDIFVVKLNENGEKQSEFNLTKNVDKNITNISASDLGHNRYIITGTYSTKLTSSSEGLFFGQLNDDEIDFIQFYNFLDFENFLSYLPEKRQEKIEKKKAKKEKKGKELKINYRIAAHGIIEMDDGYLFLGEAYYPTYRTETYTTTTTVNGATTTTTHTRTVFDGYQYTHAIISKFDKNGQVVWDEIFEMLPAYKPFYVKRFISVAQEKQNALKLVFTSKNKINAKSFDFDGNMILEIESETIQTNFEGDKAKRSFSNIDFWYDNYFIAYGSQVIKNKESEKRKRKVFFVSKIQFD